MTNSVVAVIEGGEPTVSVIQHAKIRYSSSMQRVSASRSTRETRGLAVPRVSLGRLSTLWILKPEFDDLAGSIVADHFRGDDRSRRHLPVPEASR
jgi:hypothetical protein